MPAYVVIEGHPLATNVWERMVLNLVPVNSPYWITVDRVISLYGPYLGVYSLPVNWSIACTRET